MVATIMEQPETVALTYNKSKKYVDRVLNMEYTAIVREIEDGWYMAQCDQIQGALTQGPTIEEAKENLKDAICLLLEDEMEDFRK